MNIYLKVSIESHLLTILKHKQFRSMKMQLNDILTNDNVLLNFQIPDMARTFSILYNDKNFTIFFPCEKILLNKSSKSEAFSLIISQINDRIYTSDDEKLPLKITKEYRREIGNLLFEQRQKDKLRLFNRIVQCCSDIDSTLQVVNDSYNQRYFIQSKYYKIVVILSNKNVNHITVNELHASIYNEEKESEEFTFNKIKKMIRKLYQTFLDSEKIRIKEANKIFKEYLIDVHFKPFEHLDLFDIIFNFLSRNNRIVSKDENGIITLNKTVVSIEEEENDWNKNYLFDIKSHEEFKIFQ